MVGYDILVLLSARTSQANCPGQMKTLQCLKISNASPRKRAGLLRSQGAFVAVPLQREAERRLREEGPLHGEMS